VIKTAALGAIGVRAETLDEAILKAKRGGFAGLDFGIQSVADMGAEVAKAKFAAAGVVPAVFGVPFEWRREEETWRNGLDRLTDLAAAAQTLGCTRCATWIMPASNDLDYANNLQFHVDRFVPIAQILGAHGISLGLEFVGPRTLRAQFEHGFIFNAEGMLEMAERIGPNVGLLLDSYHWYTSHGTVEQLHRLSAKEIVYVHLNDAPHGREVDEQVDGDRRLPGATGVINLPGFLRALKQMGYAGPVAVEPFYNALNDLPSDDDRLKAVKDSLDSVFAQAGVE
jgi:sugar phosphate isomerase/epimerase